MINWITAPLGGVRPPLQAIGGLSAVLCYPFLIFNISLPFRILFQNSSIVSLFFFLLFSTMRPHPSVCTMMTHSELWAARFILLDVIECCQVGHNVANTWVTFPSGRKRHTQICFLTWMCVNFSVD